ncbi:MAG: hypothetical protein KGQ41_05290 [Alphaproteobacteria bacterium]|nr:hypothetical protein [Alphaproteobacteria bacterium]
MRTRITVKKTFTRHADGALPFANVMLTAVAGGKADFTTIRSLCRRAKADFPAVMPREMRVLTTPAKDGAEGKIAVEFHVPYSADLMAKGYTQVESLLPTAKPVVLEKDKAAKARGKGGTYPLLDNVG